MSSEQSKPQQEQRKLPKPGTKARLVSALMFAFGGLAGFKLDRPTPIETKPAPLPAKTQPDLRDSNPLGILTVTSSDNDDEPRRLNLDVEKIHNPTILNEVTNVLELGLDIDTILEQLQQGALEIKIIPVTEGSGMVVYAITANPVEGSAEPFQLIGHAYGLHENDFTYDLAEKHGLGQDFVIVSLIPLDPETGKINSDEVATTVLHQGELVLPEGCDVSHGGVGCPAPAISDFIEQELESAVVAVEYHYGH
jgi:hypothetical protein